MCGLAKLFNICITGICREVCHSVFENVYCLLLSVRTRVSVCMCGHVAEVLQLLIWRSIAFIISSLIQSICPSSVSVFKSAIFSLVRLSMLINHLLSDKTVADAFSRHLFVRGFPVRVI